MASKAQSSIELISALAIILLVLVLMTAYSIEKTHESAELRTFIDAKRVCSSITDNLDSIQQQGMGYYKYFSIPARLEGNYAYNVSVNNNVVEVYWGEKAWATTTIASNVVIYCLDYGLNSTNRVRNDGSQLSITCNKPNLRPLPESIQYWNDHGNVTVSVHVENDALAASPAFNVTFDGLEQQVGGLGPYEEVELNQTIYGFPPGGHTLVISVDVHNAVDESIETDNTVNQTITI
jgi:hypothetical protein